MDILQGRSYRETMWERHVVPNAAVMSGAAHISTLDGKIEMLNGQISLLSGSLCHTAGGSVRQSGGSPSCW